MIRLEVKLIFPDTNINYTCIIEVLISRNLYFDTPYLQESFM